MRCFAFLWLVVLVACGSGGPGTDVASPDAADADAIADAHADAQADADVDAAPACPGFSYDWTAVVPGPCEPGFDAALEAKATRYERSFRAFSASAMDLNTDVTIAPANVDDRAKIEAFLRESDGWDFEAFAGKPAADVITSQAKVAGLYAGVGVAADAYRYMVLRDQGYHAPQVERARQAVLASLEALHVAVDITGAPGVIVRGLARTDLPGDGATQTLVPLTDENGSPLPEVKNNGSWRADFSAGHSYPNLIWEDSVSRDMYIGWVAAFGALWEAVRDDDAFPADKKTRLQADALALARQLMVVRASGYDLEIPDADGRTTLHGWLNEHNLDGKVYVPTLRNGFHAIMALGCVATWDFVTGDPELHAWLYDQLIGERDLPGIVDDEVWRLLDAGTISNYSNYNMAFMGAWLAFRYLDDAAALATLRHAVQDRMYDRPTYDRQPADYQYTLYDFVFAEGLLGASAVRAPGGTTEARQLAEAAVARGLQTLGWFREAPYWDVSVVNCPGWDCSVEPFVEGPTTCAASDGSSWTALGCVGRNDDLVTAEPFLMNHLPPSNYHWRSNPYVPNGGGDGSRLIPGVDFRFAYWMGRVMRKSPYSYTIQ